MAKIHRFIDNFDLSKNEIEINSETAHQIIKVLKLENGEKIELGDGKGTVALGKIKEIGKRNVIVEIEKIKKEEENKKVILFCAILKKENFELVVQKTTETGVSKIVPIISARTIKTGLNLERLKKIAKEAAEQSGRATVPEISEPISFEESLKLATVSDLNILFDASGELLFEKYCAGWRQAHSKFSAENYVHFSNNNSPLVNIFIGPEGGWTEEETKKAKDNSSFKIASLGKNILRGETAAIVATYLVSNLQ